MIGYTPEEFLGEPLLELFDDKQIKKIQQCLSEDFEGINPINLSIKHFQESLDFDGIVHRRDGVIILELEPKNLQEKTDFFDFYIVKPINFEQLKRDIPTLNIHSDRILIKCDRLYGTQAIALTLDFD